MSIIEQARALSLATILCTLLCSIALYFYRKKFFFLRPSSSYPILLPLLILFIGLLLRFSFLENFMEGKLTADEYAMSRIYSSDYLQGKSYLSGATQRVWMHLQLLWQGIFGFTPLSVRMMTSVLSLIGLYFTYLSIRRLRGFEIALWTSSILSISTYGIFFSKLSIEIGSVFFFFPAILFVCSNHSLTRVRSFALGILIASGVFCYPGFSLGLISFLGALFLISDSRKKMGRYLSHFQYILAGILLSILSIYLTQPPPTVGQRSLLLGGGSLSFNLWEHFQGNLIALQDLLIEGKSWYLIFPGISFFEWTFYPFVLVALAVGLQGKSTDIKVCALSAIINVILVGSTGEAVGMRRGVWILFPLSFLTASGMISVLHHLPSLSKYCLITAAVSLPIFYQVSIGQKVSSINFSSGYCSEIIPDDQLYGPSRLLLPLSLFYFPLDQRIMTSSRFFFKNIDSSSTIEFVDTNSLESCGRMNTQTKLLTWEYDEANNFVRNCSLDSKERHLCTEKQPSNLYIVTEQDGSFKCSSLEYPIGRLLHPENLGNLALPVFDWCDRKNFNAIGPHP